MVFSRVSVGCMGSEEGLPFSFNLNFTKDTIGNERLIRPKYSSVRRLSVCRCGGDGGGGGRARGR